MERAIIFFISVSKVAINLENKLVHKLSLYINNIRLININVSFLYKINKPAVTSVEECTNEDTGVGAAIAKGSHDENGNWALLVIKQIIKKIVKNLHLLLKLIMFLLNKMAIKLIKNISPNRFVFIVVNLELIDLILL